MNQNWKSPKVDRLHARRKNLAKGKGNNFHKVDKHNLCCPTIWMTTLRFVAWAEKPIKGKFPSKTCNSSKKLCFLTSDLARAMVLHASSDYYLKVVFNFKYRR